MEKTQEHRPIYEIAAEINKIWSRQGRGVNYAAKPYLDCMQGLNKVSDTYGYDTGKSIVLYFLSNASSFRGADAKRLKAELRALPGMR